MATPTTPPTTIMTAGCSFPWSVTATVATTSPSCQTCVPPAFTIVAPVASRRPAVASDTPRTSPPNHAERSLRRAGEQDGERRDDHGDIDEREATTLQHRPGHREREPDRHPAGDRSDAGERRDRERLLRDLAEERGEDRGDERRRNHHSRDRYEDAAHARDPLAEEP